MIERVAEAVRRYDRERLTHVPARPDDIRELLARIERLEAALRALADGADKCAEAPHYIVQPFLAIYQKHGETIASVRAALTSSDTPERPE